LALNEVKTILKSSGESYKNAPDHGHGHGHDDHGHKEENTNANNQ
jgi:hypothetical protein